MTENQKEVLTRWAYDAWDKHWRELAPKSNSRALFLKYVMRDAKKLTPELRREIELAVEQQTAAWRAQARKEKVIGVPNLSSWYNAERWTDDISHDNLSKEKECKTLPICSVPGCGRPVLGNAYTLCSFHIPHDHHERLRKAYIAAGLQRKEGETKEEQLIRIKEQGSELIRPLIKRLSGMR